MVICPGSANQCGCGASGCGVSDKVVPIEAFTAQRDEEVSWLCLARITLDRGMMARYGVGSSTVGAEVERALGASIATAVVDGPRRIGVAVRMPDATSIDPALFRLLPIPVAGGAVVPACAAPKASSSRGPLSRRN